MAEDGVATAAWRLTRRDSVRVAGRDAPSWLQGQVSQDLDSLCAGSAVWTFVLSPQGKVDSFGRLWRLAEDEYLFDVEAGWGSALAERLRRFRIRVKADLALSEVLVVEGRGAGTAGLPPWLTADGPAIDGTLSVEVAFPGYEGTDVLLLSDSAVATAARGEETGTGSGEAVEFMRIAAGWPALGAEITEKTIPQELGQQVVDRSVSFTKGCYTGQELVARLDARGSNVPRRLRGVVVPLLAGSDHKPLPGDEIVVADAVVGRLTSVAPTPDGDTDVALGFVKRGVGIPSECAVGDRRLRATIRDLPLEH
jgi:folate-binding protein YgfZ